jgi:hypothetical protein
MLRYRWSSPWAQSGRLKSAWAKTWKWRSGGGRATAAPRPLTPRACVGSICRCLMCVAYPCQVPRAPTTTTRAFKWREERTGCKHGQVEKCLCSFVVAYTIARFLLVVTDASFVLVLLLLHQLRSFPFAFIPLCHSRSAASAPRGPVTPADRLVVIFVFVVVFTLLPIAVVVRSIFSIPVFFVVLRFALLLHNRAIFVVVVVIVVDAPSSPLTHGSCRSLLSPGASAIPPLPLECAARPARPAG